MNSLPDSQTWIVLLLAVAAAAYLLRNALKGAAEGGCATGCGACRKSCSLRALEARLKAKN